MKALSVKQGWASAIYPGPKRIETRSWYTAYRGDILICASRSEDKHFRFNYLKPDDCIQDWAVLLNYVREHHLLGKAICVARLVDCRPMMGADEEAACCVFYSGAFAWVLEDIRPVKPFEVQGKLGLFEVELPDGVIV